MKFNLFYLISSVIFIIGAVRIYIIKKFEFRYYNALELGEFSTLISILFLLLGIYFMYKSVKTH